MIQGADNVRVRMVSLSGAPIALFLVLMLTLLANQAAASPATVTRTIGFVRSVSLALQGNPAAQKATAAVQQARAKVTQVRGLRLPRLLASLNAMRTNDPLNVFGAKLQQREASFNDFGAGQFNPNDLAVQPSGLNYPGYYDNFQSQLALQIPIWQGGKLSAMAAEANEGLEAARAGDTAARQQVIFELLVAYDGVRAARALVRVAAVGERAAEQYAAVSRQLYRRGIAVKSDWLTAQVHLSASRLQLARARAREQTAVELFHVAMGAPVSSPLEVGGSFIPPLPRQSLVELQRQAIASNPRYQAANAKRLMSKAGVAQARSAYLPKLNLELLADWNSPSLGFTGRSYTAVAQVSWDLFDFGARRGALNGARAAADQAAATLRSARSNLMQELDDAYRKALLARDALRTRALEVRQAAEAERILAERYRHGIATLTNLLTAEARLEKTQADRVLSRYSLAVATASIWRDIGRLNLIHIRRWAKNQARGGQINETNP